MIRIIGVAATGNTMTDSMVRTSVANVVQRQAIEETPENCDGQYFIALFVSMY